MAPEGRGREFLPWGWLWVAVGQVLWKPLRLYRSQVGAVLWPMCPPEPMCCTLTPQIHMLTVFGGGGFGGRFRLGEVIVVGPP